MAQWAVRDKAVSIRRACQLFAVSETCYRYQARLSSDNALIADWLLRRGCKNFCVNGSLAGDCRLSRESENDRKQRTD